VLAYAMPTRTDSADGAQPHGCWKPTFKIAQHVDIGADVDVH